MRHSGLPGRGRPVFGGSTFPLRARALFLNTAATTDDANQAVKAGRECLILLDEQATPMRLLFLGLIVGGVVGSVRSEAGSWHRLNGTDSTLGHRHHADAHRGDATHDADSALNWPPTA
jgi:hypothetical protein